MTSKHHCPAVDVEMAVAWGEATPIHTQHRMMLQRNMLYTAVTRGKKLVVLVGTKKAIAIAVKRMEASQRITTLKDRLVARPVTL